MQLELELGAVIIDKTGDCDDIGVVVEVGDCNYGDHYGDLYCKIYWTCRREPEGRDYTITLSYTQEEINNDAIGVFEVIG